MKRAAYQAALGSLGLIAKLMSLRKPTIFCFHSVLAEDFDLSSESGMAVSAVYLERLILDLRAQGIPVISLSEAVSRIEAGESEPFLVLTFDDGYRNNYDALFPLMVRLQTPFTIFVTTGLIDQTIPMWWDSLERLFASKMATSGGTTLRELSDQFRAGGPAEQGQLLTAIADANVGLVEEHAYQRSLTWAMVREMCASGLLTVGSHTQHHPLLSRLTGDEIRSELIGSRRRIEQELDISVDYLAYPYGQPWEVGNLARQIADEVGFKAAFSTIARPLSRGDSADMFNLPRILLSSKAQSTNIALAYMSGLPATLKRSVDVAVSQEL